LFELKAKGKIQLSNRIPSDGEIVLHPRAWFDSAWWTSGQLENLTKLIDRIKREYNIDESRVYVTGISDGGAHYRDVQAHRRHAAVPGVSGCRA
jgi:predicted peptidase